MITHHFFAPFDFTLTARYIGRYENAQAHAVSDKQFCQVLADEQGYYLVEVTPGGANSVEAKVVVGKESSSRMEQISHYLRRSFGSDEELSRFYEFSESDRNLKKWTSAYKGLRLVGIYSLWECLSWSIIGQQVSVASAFSTRSRLALYCGATVEWQDKIYEGFPTPEAVLSLTQDELLGCGLSRQKGEYLQGLAQELISEYLSESLLMAPDPQEIRDRLIEIRGIGPWSVEYAMMRVHGDADACPYEDIGLRNALAREYDLGRQASIEETRQITESWRPFRSYATFYIWFTLLNTP
ncbi:MAG: DNA-3-methyladenine glycosylase 2 family protein [Calditrichaeota bacterium]|nr:DNA-3-methyladenine glycosylase 2 family protein [Calditrichota bacterium]MCB9369080.1 DNA-3-methyladenine glycosylase 2 family protein [Calditrichota bacterium]